MVFIGDAQTEAEFRALLNGVAFKGGNIEDIEHNNTIYDENGQHVPSSILEHNSININGTEVSLGGSITVGISGILSLDSDLEAPNGETLWDESNTYIPNARLESDVFQVVAGDGLKTGGSASLGGSVTVDIEPADFAGNGLTDDGTDNLALVNDSVTVSAGGGLSGGGSVSLGSSVTLSIQNDSVSISGETVSLGGSNSRFNTLAFDNIEDPGNTRAIGIDDSEGVLFKDSGGSTYPLWNSKYVSGDGDVTVSGGSGAGSTPITLGLDSNFITINGTDVSLGGSVSIEGGSIDLGDDEEGFFGTNNDMSIRYDSAADSYVWQDNTNGADRASLDRTTGDMSIEGTLTEGANL